MYTLPKKREVYECKLDVIIILMIYPERTPIFLYVMGPKVNNRSYHNYVRERMVKK